MNKESTQRRVFLIKKDSKPNVVEQQVVQDQPKIEVVEVKKPVAQVKTRLSYLDNLSRL
jgi:ribosomal protein L19